MPKRATKTAGQRGVIPLMNSVRKLNKKQHTPDYYPVQRRIPLSGTLEANGQIISGVMHGDAGKLLSQANRRLYRYGMNYRIKLDLDVSEAVDNGFDVRVFALRNNWDVQRAFALAKKVYDDAYAHELDATASGNLARWRDFRVDDGVTGSIELNPVKNDNVTLAPSVDSDGEHSLSRVDYAGNNVFFTWGNAVAGASIDIVNEWIQAGRTSADPNVAITNAPYEGVNSDELSDIEMGNLGNHGNSPPYNATSDGDLLYEVGTLRYEPATPSGTGLQKLSTGYFDAPCGLFVIAVTGGINLGAGTVVLTAQAGDYKGTSAAKMCQ